MAAHVYPYNRMPPAPLAGPSKRYPLNTVNHNYGPIPTVKPPISPKATERQLKPPASPPLARQNSKTVPPSPPRIITDKAGKSFQRIGFLGEGGFARVYEIKDSKGQKLACKVVTKNSLKTKKAKTKLYAEIRIHKMLDHPNIVNFLDCFEDEENVYMTLELCLGGSLMDLFRRRRRLSEPETRFFMVQILGACHYMHTHQVIHRDLKLGNIFLDANMNIKVGDFGLAALIENEGERKKTICGTPNYIAPEVLFDTANGHSYEVDTWSTGVILYTLLIGRPPFQTKDVKGIYDRIKQNQYDFPDDRPVSSSAQELITGILTKDPALRPTIHEIVEHEFLGEGTFPSYIPISSNERPPDFSSINRAISQANYRRVKRKALLDSDQVTTIALPQKPPVSSSSVGAPARSVASTIAQQEKEFQKAVQPGSPIAALLSSARQPLVMSTAATGGGNVRESPLMRKLQASARPASSPLGPKSGARRGLHGIEEEQTEQEHRERAKKKELEAMKARIVAQMAEKNETEDERENVPPPNVNKAVRRPVETKPTVPLPTSLAPPSASKEGHRLRSGLTGFDAAAEVLTLAFDAMDRKKLFRDPRQNPQLPLMDAKVFVVSWVDYCNKYGMGYALTDGSVGVHFNDTTSMVLSADKQHFDYLTAREQGLVFVRKSFTVDEYPDELKSKVYLLKHFERYIMDRLYGEYDYTFEDVDRAKGMDWVQKYLRMKNLMIFKMSHDVLQFNFSDHTKIILSAHGLLITYIDKAYKVTKFSLRDVMANALRGCAGLDEAATKFNHRLLCKLKYSREVMMSISNAKGGEQPTGAMEQGMVKRVQPSAELR